MKKLLAATLAAYLLLCAACTPIPAPTPMPAVPDDPSVKTDWSHLSPYESEKPVYTRRFAEFTNSLIPADDYGPLIPFLGDKLGGVGGEGERYGLVTLDGEVVVDPVFSNVWRGDSSGGYHNASPLPYMMLSKGVSSPSRDKWPGGGGWDINSNCTEEGIFLMDGDALVYLDGATGRELLRIEDIPEDKRHDALFSVRRDGSGAVYQCYDDNAQGTDHYRQTFRADASGSRRLTGLEAELAQLRYQDGKALRYPDVGAHRCWTRWETSCCAPWASSITAPGRT